MNAAAAGEFPWAEILSLGLGVLRLSPRQFWALTLPELRHACGLAAWPAMLPDRGELDRLMQLYPD